MSEIDGFSVILLLLVSCTSSQVTTWYAPCIWTGPNPSRYISFNNLVHLDIMEGSTPVSSSQDPIPGQVTMKVLEICDGYYENRELILIIIKHFGPSSKDGLGSILQIEHG